MKSSKISTLTSITMFLLAGGLLSGCSDKPEDAANIAAKQSKEVIAPSLEAASASIESMGATATEGAAMVSETTSAAVNAGAETVNQATDAAADLVDSTVGSAQGLIQGAQDATSSAVSGAQDAASSAISSVQDATSSAVSGAQDVASSAVSGAQDAASSAVSGAQNMASSAASATQAIVSDATDVVSATPDIIRGVQQGLVNAGFNPGPVDGMTGAKTVTALQSFQKQNNLAVGSITKETLRALGVNF